MTTKRKPIVVLTTVTLNLNEMAHAMMMTPEMVRDGMRDGRGAWPWSEVWGDRYCQMAAGDYEGANLPPTIIALGKGNIRFQRPKRFGVNRDGDEDDLIRDLESVRSVVVVDLRAFPQLRLVDIPSDYLVGAVKTKALTINGWSGNRFDKWLNSRFDIEHKTVRAASFRGTRNVRGITRASYVVRDDADAEVTKKKTQKTR